MNGWMNGRKKYDGCKMANSWPATAARLHCVCVCVCVCVCILMATKNERIVTIRLLPLYCRNSARYEAPLKPSTSPRTRKTQKPSSTIPIPRGNKVETHITQSSTEVRRWNQPPLPLVDSISPRSFPPFFIANGKTKKTLERGGGGFLVLLLLQFMRCC